MTQQINLYARKVEQKRGPLIMSLALVGLVVGLLMVYWMMVRNETSALQARVNQAKSQLAAEQQSVQLMKAELAKRTDPAKIAAEIAAIRARATEAEEIIGQLQRGEIGTMEGFNRQFVALARIGEPGVWLTGFKLVNSGKGVEIQGRSLQAESVLKYAGEVNQRFSEFGASVSAFELTPIAQGPSAAAPAVSFKLF
jgi:hypothetical protein